MNKLEDFNYIFEELGVFLRNIKKENEDRRLNLAVIDKNLAKLTRISNEFELLVGKTKIAGDELLNDLISRIKNLKNNINEILIDRLAVAKSKDSLRGLDNNSVVNLVKMGEKFDLKVAAGLLPLMDNSETGTQQLINGIELYSELLNDEGKVMLIKYVLKTKLTASARLRLKSEYGSTEALVCDIKLHFISKKSAAALSIELHNAKQLQKSVEDFGKTIEDLMVNLTLSQADGKDELAKTLTNTNEKIAINAFANGLRDSDLKFLIKARNFGSLPDAIAAAKDEDSAKRSSASIFSMRKYSNFRDSNLRQNNNTRNFSMQRSNYNKNKTFYTGHRNNFNKGNYSNSRGNNHSNNFHRSFQNRGRGNNFRGPQKGYFLNDSQNYQNSGTSTESTRPFFRAPQ